MHSQIKHHTARLRKLLKHLLGPKLSLKLSELPQLERLFRSTESGLKILHFHYQIHFLFTCSLKKKNYDRIETREKISHIPSFTTPVLPCHLILPFVGRF